MFKIISRLNNYSLKLTSSWKFLSLTAVIIFVIVPMFLKINTVHLLLFDYNKELYFIEKYLYNLLIIF